MVNIEKRLSYIGIYQQGADHWKTQGNSGREASSLCALLMNVLAIAVQKFTSAAEAADWFNRKGFSQYQTRHIDLLEILVTDLKEDKIPASSIGAGYTTLALSAFAWALDEDEIGETYVQLMADDRVLKLMSPFWREYHRAVHSLMTGKTYSPAELKKSGAERYWKVYLELIGALTDDRETSTAIANVGKAFIERNADKKIKEDAYEVEGCPGSPVKWDFRKDGLLGYASRRS